MTKGKIRIYHRHFFTQIISNEWCHRLNLTFHISNARLQGVAVKRPTSNMMPFGDNKIWHLEFTCTRR